MGLYLTGVPAFKPILGEPPTNSAAHAAGIRAGEIVTRIGGERIESWQDMHWRVLREGIDAERLELETRDAAGHLYFRTLDLSVVADADRENRLLETLGLMRFMPEIAPVVGELLPHGRAASAGLQSGDRILAVDGQAVARWDQLVQYVRQAPARKIELTVERDRRSMLIVVTPDASTEAGQTVGKIGAGPRIPTGTFEALQTQMRYPLGAAFVHAVDKTWELSSFSLEMLGRMVIGQVSLKNISGPVTIADYAGQSARSSLNSFIAFLALISISLGVLNLLPIPLLDGGHLLYYLAEIMTGRPVPERIQEIGQKVGMALLGVLMFLALFNDFQRLLTQ